MEVDSFVDNVRSREVTKVVAALDADAAVGSSLSQGGEGGLHVAAAAGDITLLQALLKYKPTVDLANIPAGRTPLMAAARAGHVAAIRLLADAGANIDAVSDATGDTAVHCAAEAGDIDTLSYVIGTMGAKVALTAGTTGGTPLHAAARSGSTRCIGLLLYAHSIPIDACDAAGATALAAAIAAGHAPAATFLLEHGAAAAASASPLLLAAAAGATDTVKLLLALGADATAAGPDGKTALQVAEASGHKAAAKELAKQPKDAAAKTADAARFKAHGNRVFADGENVKAAKFYSQAIQNEPTNHVFFSNRAAASFNLRNFWDGYYDSVRCIAIAPKWPRGYFRKAANENGMKMSTEARATIAAGLAHDKGNRELQVLLEQINKTS